MRLLSNPDVEVRLNRRFPAVFGRFINVHRGDPDSALSEKPRWGHQSRGTSSPAWFTGAATLECARLSKQHVGDSREGVRSTFWSLLWFFCVLFGFALKDLNCSFESSVCTVIAVLFQYNEFFWYVKLIFGRLKKNWKIQKYKSIIECWWAIEGWFKYMIVESNVNIIESNHYLIE